MADAPRLLHVFSTFAAGGPQVRTARLMNAFGAAYRHAVVAMDGRTEARDLLGPELDVAILDTPPRAGSMRTAKAMRALLAREGCDLLLTYNWGAIDTVLAARSLGMKRVLHAEDGFLPDEAGGQKRRRVWTRRLLLPGTAGVIVPSRNLERIAVEVWKLKPDHVHWIPNGIDFAHFAYNREKPPDPAATERLLRSIGVPVGAPVIGCCGHLRPEKNVGRLLDTLALLADKTTAHLLVLGDGEQRAELERRAADPPLKGRVHFLGHREDTRPYLAAMEVFAISSDTEQMPVALLEAMAAALPVVSTEVGDVRSMLPDEQGQMLVRVQGKMTAAALSAALLHLLEQKGMQRRFGRLNRARVEERYSFEGMLAAYRERYEAALAL